MPPKRLGFKKSHKDILRANDAALRFMAGGRDVAPELLNNLPPKRERAAPRKLEAPVITAISELLSAHPRVIWAARFNSGAAGEHGHIWFHRFVRMPEPMRMPDFFGLVQRRVSYNSQMETHIIPFSCEAKAPGWTKPRDEREREQAAFLAMIRDAGGIGIFATDVKQVADALA